MQLLVFTFAKAMERTVVELPSKQKVPPPTLEESAKTSMTTVQVLPTTTSSTCIKYYV